MNYLGRLTSSTKECLHGLAMKCSIMKDCFCTYICCRVIMYLVTDHSIIKHLTRKRKFIKRLGRPLYKPQTIIEESDEEK